MARPRYDENTLTARQRILDAAETMFRTMPLGQISMRELTEQASCNRSTFYYHFSDIYEVFDELTEEVIPSEIASIITKLFSSVPSEAGNDQIAQKYTIEKLEAFFLQNEDRLDRIGWLLNSPSGNLARERFIEIAQGAWEDLLATRSATLDDQRVQLLFRFAINGILGILAYRASCEPPIPIGEVIDVIYPEFPQTVMTLLNELAPPRNEESDPYVQDKNR